MLASCHTPEQLSKIHIAATKHGQSRVRRRLSLVTTTVSSRKYRYQKAKLVHADFSEYNILLHDGELVVIDVSQAVEHAHPHALEFLRMDISNVNDFFGRKVCCVASPPFVVRLSTTFSKPLSLHFDFNLSTHTHTHTHKYLQQARYSHK